MKKKASDMEEIRAGTSIPPLRFTADLKALVKYAAATWDFHRYHYDADYAIRTGMDRPFVDGQMFGALLARSLMSWAGPDSFLGKLSYRQDAMVFVDETIVITGTVRKTEKEGKYQMVSLEMDVAKEDGTRVIAGAHARVRLPRADHDAKVTDK